MPCISTRKSATLAVWLFAHWCLALLLVPTAAMATPSRALINASELRAELAVSTKRERLLLLDASPTPAFRAAHIPGAVLADFYAYGLNPGGPAQMQQRLRLWGVRPDEGQRIVVYDGGGTHMAPRLFFDLISHGVAASRIRLLDGGLHQWRLQGGPLATGAPDAVEPGDIAVEVSDARWRAELPEVLARRAILMDALDPPYYFGAQRFMDRGGHLPGAMNLPASSLFRADKTFVPAVELEARLARLGLRREQSVISYCGGGVAAAVPFFALHALLDWQQVKLYVGSQREYLLDDRQLPMWQDTRPLLLRDRVWLEGWGQPMLRQMNAVHFALVDLRPRADFEREHLPYAIPMPMDRWRALRKQPQQLAQWLAEQGLQRSQEVVLVSGNSGLDADKALAMVLLESVGQWRVSLLRDTVDEWALSGGALEKGEGKLRASAQTYPMQAAAEWVVQPADSISAVVLDLDVRQPERSGDGVSLPLALMLEPSGQPRSAWQRWEQLMKAGVASDATLIVRASDPGDAALGFVLLRQLGLPTLKVRL